MWASMPQEEIMDAPPPPQATSSQPIALSVEEKLTISLSQEGAQAFDLKGNLSHSERRRRRRQRLTVAPRPPRRARRSRPTRRSTRRPGRATASCR